MPQNLSVIKQPAPIANGDNDRMVPQQHSLRTWQTYFKFELIVYKDAGHGGIFQNNHLRALDFYIKIATTERKTNNESISS